MGGTDPAQRQAARAQLIASPEAHGPVLVGVIRRGKTRWNSDILPWLDDIPQLASRRTRQLVLERNAIDVLQRMGAPAAPHVVTLLSETRYGGRDTAIALLRAYGPAACPLLIASLHDSNPLIRAGVAATLGRFPSEILGSLEPLRIATRDPHPAVRVAAIEALGQMQDRATEVIPDLVLALGDRTPEVQIQAASSLRAFGNQAAAAVETLRKCLGASADPVRAEAALTLAAIGGDAARTAGPELLMALRQRDGPSARQASVALVSLDLHPQEALQRLTGFLRHSDVTIRSRTLDAIRSLGPLGEPLVPDILALLENADDKDNRPALAALRAIQPSAIPERYRQGRRSR
jgi:HEAT repeat protein